MLFTTSSAATSVSSMSTRTMIAFAASMSVARYRNPQATAAEAPRRRSTAKALPYWLSGGNSGSSSFDDTASVVTSWEDYAYTTTYTKACRCNHDGKHRSNIYNVSLDDMCNAPMAKKSQLSNQIATPPLEHQYSEEEPGVFRKLAERSLSYRSSCIQWDATVPVSGLSSQSSLDLSIAQIACENSSWEDRVDDATVATRLSSLADEAQFGSSVGSSLYGALKKQEERRSLYCRTSERTSLNQSKQREGVHRSSAPTSAPVSVPSMNISNTHKTKRFSALALCRKNKRDLLLAKDPEEEEIRRLSHSSICRCDDNDDDAPPIIRGNKSLKECQERACAKLTNPPRRRFHNNDDTSPSRKYLPRNHCRSPYQSPPRIPSRSSEDQDSRILNDTVGITEDSSAPDLQETESMDSLQKFMNDISSLTGETAFRRRAAPEDVGIASFKAGHKSCPILEMSRCSSSSSHVSEDGFQDPYEFPPSADDVLKQQAILDDIQWRRASEEAMHKSLPNLSAARLLEETAGRRPSYVLREENLYGTMDISVLSLNADLHTAVPDSTTMTSRSGFNPSTLTTLGDNPAQDHNLSMYFRKNPESPRPPPRPAPKQILPQPTSHKIVHEAYTVISRHERHSAVGEDRLETLASGEQIWVMGNEHFWHDLIRHRPMRIIKCPNCIAILQVQAKVEQFFCSDCGRLATLQGIPTATEIDLANAIQRPVEEAQDFLIATLEIQQEYVDAMRHQGRI
jgi:hypothetical protein